MLETIAWILWMALCYVAGYLLGMCIAEWINANYREEFFAHV